MHEVVTTRELEESSVELLPGRETLALFNVTNIVAVNLAIAVNAYTFGSAANATALQQIAVLQR
jgi:hypothetical protein